MLQQVLVDGRLRRLMVIRRTSRALLVVALVAAVAVAVAIGAGRGGSEDGTLGAVIALVALVGGAYFIQRLSKQKVLFGFNPEGVYAPGREWVDWSRVRRIEVRRSGNVVTGRRTVVWVAYAPGAGTGPGAEAEAATAVAPDEPLWLAINPGWSQGRTVELAAELERCWTGARPAPAPPER